MADAKISGLTEVTAPASGDYLVVDDVSDTTQAASGTSKKLTYANLFAAVGVDAAFNSNTTLGDASGDTLTVNAGTWTLGSNYTATRAAGALATGTTILQALNSSFSGDAGGATTGRGMNNTVTASGSNAFTAVEGHRQTLIISTSAGATTTAKGMTSTLTLSGAGTATGARCIDAVFSLTSSGTITTADNFLAQSPTLSSTGAITTLTGFRTQDLGHATLVTNAVGFDAANFTAAATLTAAYRSQMTSGTGKWGFYASGTADNAFSGNVRIGSTTAPSYALDVTGAVRVSGNLGFFSTTPVAQSTGWAVSNVTTDKVFNANATSIDELADVLGTLITYLISRGDLAA